ncbi:MAG TPA: hypothetical protein VKB51_11320 [bacterium]|nr:hypothetical protein [bacterium]
MKSTSRWVLLCMLLAAPLGLALSAEPEPAQGEHLLLSESQRRLVIELRDPRSWADYYAAIGHPLRAMVPIVDDWAPLAAHCAWLTKVTGHTWLPLGYELTGIRMCYRTSPHSLKEADVLCARLRLHAVVSNERRIVCD